MIRVKIRYNSPNAKAFLLCFDESIEFEALLHKIAAKLGVLPNDGDKSDQTELSQLFQLTLEGDAVVQECSEIEHGDDLVLKRIHDEGDTVDVDAKSIAAPQSATNDLPAMSIKKEVEAATARLDGDEEESVQDATEEMLQRRAAQEKEKEHDVIVLSSDEDKENSEQDNSDEESVDDDDDDDDDDDGSEEWHDALEGEEQSDDSSSSDFHPEEDAKPASIGSRKRIRAPPMSPIQVIMDEKDVPAAPGKRAEIAEGDDGGGLEEMATLVEGASRNKADSAVKDRIIKLLNTGFHDQSNEHEAKNAMKLAQRLMRKHNLSQAILLKEREIKNKQGATNSDEELRGGMVKVHIKNRKTGKVAQFARWISDFSCVVASNFGVKVYREIQRGKRCDVVFYGIYINAQLAGYAFRVATERIAQMTAEYTPSKSTFRLTSSKSSRLSYALGIVSGIREEVEKNIRLEKESRQRKLERARQAVSTGEAYVESDEEAEGSISADLADDETDGPSFAFPTTHDPQHGEGDATSAAPVQNVARNHLHPAATNVSKSSNGRLQQLEREEQAALVLVDHGEKVAEVVLEEHGIKLRSGRKRKEIQFDRHSFRRGLEDSKEIDINQRAIRDETKVKEEVKRE